MQIEYEKTIKANTFHKKISFRSKFDVLGNEEAFIFHSPSTMLHFDKAELVNDSGITKVIKKSSRNFLTYNAKGEEKKSKIVKRGINEVVEKIEPDEIQEFDHLCFVVHGIGEGCDFKFRPLEDCGKQKKILN